MDEYKTKVETWLDEYSKIALEVSDFDCEITVTGLDNLGKHYSNSTHMSKKEALDIFNGFIGLLR